MDCIVVVIYTLRDGPRSYRRGGGARKRMLYRPHLCVCDSVREKITVESQ